jgi:hypothetical protein
MPSAGETANPPRRTALRALLILVAITVVVAALAAAYLLTRPSYAGQWVGPGNIQGSGDPSAIVASLALQQNLLGGINGTGMVCAASNGTLSQIPVSVSGSLSGASANLTLHASGNDTALVPASLPTTANLSQGQLTLTADTPVHLLLTLQPGSASDFSDDCNLLLQPASGG